MKKIIINLLTIIMAAQMYGQCQKGATTTYSANTNGSPKTYTIGSTNFTGDVIVKNGVTLNMTGTFRFKEEADFLIENGADVYINNSTLTTFCAQTLWNGIRIITNRTQCIPVSGYVSIKNSIFEFSSFGVDASPMQFPGSIYPGDLKGGSLYCENTRFRHNLHNDIIINSMLHPHVKDPSTGFYLPRLPIGIKNCTFLDDATSLSFATAGFPRQKQNIWIRGKSCPIQDNTFINNANQNDNSYITNILADVANSLQIGGNIFKSCQNAIEISRSQYGNINGNTFEDCRIHSESIYLNESSDLLVSLNKFIHDGTPLHIGSSPQVGVINDIYYSGGNNNRIENNYFRFRKPFSNISMGNLKYYSIVVDNTGTLNKWVFKNVFDLKLDNQFPIYVGRNNGLNNNAGNSKGTHFICNEFHWDKLNNNIKFHDAASTAAYTQASTLFSNGAVVASAGNRFSTIATNPSSSRFHIEHPTTSTAMEYHFSGSATVSNNKYPSTITNASIGLAVNSNPNQCLVNWESPGWTNVWDSELSNPAYGSAPPLPIGVFNINNVRAHRITVHDQLVTAKSSLATMLSSSNAQPTELANQYSLVNVLKTERDYMSSLIIKDTVQNRPMQCEEYDHSEVISLYRSYENFESEFEIADYFIGLYKFDAAISYLNNANNIYTLTTEQQTDFTNTAVITGIMKSIEDTNRPNKSLTIAEKTSLESIANTNNGHSARRACIMLSKETNSTCHIPELIQSSNTSSGTNVVINNSFQLFPNPAITHINISNTNMINLNQDYLIKIYDLSGNEMHTEIMQSSMQSINIDVNYLQNGNYICNIYDINNTVQASLGFVINR